MTLLFHPEFAEDLRRFEEEYGRVSEALKTRFRAEALSAIEAIRKSPQSAGHYFSVNSAIVPEFRRRNLRAFPFFILYGVTTEAVIVGSLVPSRSDPLT
jgi:hypothetical protein